MMAEQQKEQQKEKPKLGAVTFTDPDKTGQPVSAQGITFLPGEAVNVDELLPPEQAERLKEKLAGNQFFSVQGGPDHRKVMEARGKHEAEATEKKQELDEKQRQREQHKIEANRPEQPTLEQREQPKHQRR
jgi:hypothetical protein